MRPALLIVLALGCGEKKKREEIQIATPDPVFTGSGSSDGIDGAPEVPGPATPVLPKLEFSDEVAPPRPFDKLVPRMKQADVLAILGAANVHATTTAPSDFAFGDRPVYQWGQPELRAALWYADNRLVGITIQSTDERVLTAVRDRWGKPATIDPKSFNGVESTWPSGASGWTAKLHTKPMPDRLVFSAWRITELEFESAERAAATVAVGDDLFVKLAPLVGAPLANAERVFGPGLRREIADSDEGSPERGELRQGFASVTVPWSPQPWDLVLAPESAADRVRTVTVSGATVDEEGRVALFSALRKGFGVDPKPVVSDAGRFEVRFVTAALKVRVAEPSENNWTIVIRRTNQR